MLEKPKAVLFDFGDTILKVKQFDLVNGYIQTLQSCSQNGLKNKEFATRIVTDVEAFLTPFKKDAVLQYRTECIQNLIFELLRLKPICSSSDFELKLWKSSTRFTPEDGIEPVLSLLKSENIKLGVISNSSFSGRVIEWELERHNLLHYFSFVISSADYGVRKPHPYLFKIGVNRLEVNKTHIWFIGDKKEYDVQGALNSDLHPIWYNRQSGKDSSDPGCAEVHSWQEFINLYESI